SRQYGIERPVVLLENAETDVPVTWGIVYPVILLPSTAAQWDEEQRIAVLTHELAHVKRFDALTQLVAQLALALLWFHPLVWMAVRRMRLEREHACDDFVLVAGARPSRYADDLLGLARRLTRPTAPAAAALAMARRSELEGRLLAILDPATKRSTDRRDQSREADDLRSGEGSAARADRQAIPAQRRAARCISGRRVHHDVRSRAQPRAHRAARQGFAAAQRRRQSAAQHRHDDVGHKQ